MKMVIRNLLRRKTRTLLTLLGISVGVAAIIGLGTMAEGLDAGYDSMLSGSNADLVLSQPDVMDISMSSVEAEIANELEAMPEVEEVSGMLQGFMQAEASPVFFIFGYSEDSFILDRFNIIRGTGLYDRAAQQGKGKPVILGSAAAESFKKDVGDSIRLGSSTYRVVGIYQTGQSFEDGGSVLPLEEAQILLGKSRQVSLFYIRLKDNAERESVQSRVERRWPDLTLSSTSEYADQQVMGDFMKVYVWVIAGLAIVLGGVGMANAQLMAVFERTREIGVLRAVGWTRKRVLRMILLEALVVSVIGGLLGIGLGWLFLVISSDFMALFGTSSTNIGIDLIIQAVVTVLLLGLAGGLYPAMRAANLQPIEALRYEGGTAGEHVRRLPFGGMALQSLWQRALRTSLTLVVIGLTVGAIMALEATLRGTAQSMTELARGADAEIMVRQAEIADTSMSAIDQRLTSKIQALPEVANVSGLIFTATMLPDTGGFLIIQGYSPHEQAIQRFNIVEGEGLSGNHQVIIGRSIAESMNKGPGDTLEISGNRYRVTGVYESGIGWEDAGCVMTLRDGQSFVGRPRKVTMLAVRVSDPSQAEAVVEKINAIDPQLHAALAGEFVEQMPDMESSDAMMTGISMLTIIVGGLGVMNTMLMAVVERTREIGVLRALGWRRRAVLKMILKEAFLLGILGGLVGIAIAFLLVGAIKMAPMVGDVFNVIWELSVFTRAIGVALALALVGGLYPAYRATRLLPVEALRYE
ncbi:MAG: ABC transporter permease [Anaerolineaceae bacterium]|nr:ABC transporter permease [Anaerolineaceae bacterium]